MRVLGNAGSSSLKLRLLDHDDALHTQHDLAAPRSGDVETGAPPAAIRTPVVTAREDLVIVRQVRVVLDRRLEDGAA
jgi:hypothetical protein